MAYDNIKYNLSKFSGKNYVILLKTRMISLSSLSAYKELFQLVMTKQ